MTIMNLNKAILVIDMPDSCRRCMCYVLGESNNFCSVTKFAIFDGSTKPHHCPLKPVPEKYEIDKTKRSDPFYEFEFECGYNQCIDEILGQ